MFGFQIVRLRERADNCQLKRKSWLFLDWVSIMFQAFHVALFLDWVSVMFQAFHVASLSFKGEPPSRRKLEESSKEVDCYRLVRLEVAADHFATYFCVTLLTVVCCIFPFHNRLFSFIIVHINHVDLSLWQATLKKDITPECDISWLANIMFHPCNVILAMFLLYMFMSFVKRYWYKKYLIGITFLWKNCDYCEYLC
jgi:hypothetical protein